MQASKNNINNIIKIKKNFSTKKIEEVYKIMNNIKKKRPKINITTKCYSASGLENFIFYIIYFF